MLGASVNDNWSSPDSLMKEEAPSDPVPKVRLTSEWAAITISGLPSDAKPVIIKLPSPAMVTVLTPLAPDRSMLPPPPARLTLTIVTFCSPEMDAASPSAKVILTTPCWPPSGLSPCCPASTPGRLSALSCKPTAAPDAQPMHSQPSLKRRYPAVQ